MRVVTSSGRHSSNQPRPEPAGGTPERGSLESAAVQELDHADHVGIVAQVPQVAQRVPHASPRCEMSQEVILIAQCDLGACSACFASASFHCG